MVFAERDDLEARFYEESSDERLTPLAEQQFEHETGFDQSRGSDSRTSLVFQHAEETFVPRLLERDRHQRRGIDDHTPSGP